MTAASSSPLTPVFAVMALCVTSVVGLSNNDKPHAPQPVVFHRCKFSGLTIATQKRGFLAGVLDVCVGSDGCASTAAAIGCRVERKENNKKNHSLSFQPHCPNPRAAAPDRRRCRRALRCSLFTRVFIAPCARITAGCLPPSASRSPRDGRCLTR
jgi:hypothetical protein